MHVTTAVTRSNVAPHFHQVVQQFTGVHGHTCAMIGFGTDRDMCMKFDTRVTFMYINCDMHFRYVAFTFGETGNELNTHAFNCSSYYSNNIYMSIGK